MMRGRTRRAIGAVVAALVFTTGLSVAPSPWTARAAADPLAEPNGWTLFPSLNPTTAEAAPQYLITLTDSTLDAHRDHFVQAAQQVNTQTKLRVRVAPGIHPNARPTGARAEIVVDSVPAMLNPANGSFIDGYSGIRTATSTHQRVDSDQRMQLDPEIWGKSWAYRHSLILHELGHALGLDHDPDEAQLMHWDVNSLDGGTLKAGDIRGLNYLGRNLISTNCSDVEVITARGTNAPQGHDPTTAALLTAARRELERAGLTVTDHALVYPATVINPSYPVSIAAGETALRSRLDVCAGRTVKVLIGYSQGANVISDALDNVGTQPTSAQRRSIAAAVLVGDSSYRSDETWSRGSAAGGTRLQCQPGADCVHVPYAGFVPRAKGSLDFSASALRSYCQSTDGVCALADPLGTGGTHSTYYVGEVALHEEAAAFITSRATVALAPPVPSTVTTFSSAATSSLSRSGEQINAVICDPNRVGQRVWLHLSRSGANFPAVDRVLSGTAGCATFTDLDGAGPPLAVSYAARVGLNQYPSLAWGPDGCYATTGGQGLCDVERTKAFSAASVSTPTWTTDVISYRVCDANRVGEQVHVQLSRPGKTFPVVVKQMPVTGCVTFSDLDGAGPVNPDTTYALKAAIGGPPDPAWPATSCFKATGGLGLCDSVRTSRFTSQATTQESWTTDQISYRVCDPGRVGHRVWVQLSREGRTFDPVSALLPQGGCHQFTDLDLAGPVLPDTTYVIRAGMNQVPSPAWPSTGCHAATGGLGMCDIVKTASHGATFQMPFRCNETWIASNYPGHGWGNIDFNRSGDAGAPVLASADGTVYLTSWQEDAGGHVIWIKHANGMFTLYAHLRDRPLPAKGQVVSRGQTIGYVGSTGGSTGTHLHYEQQDTLNHAVRPRFNGVLAPIAGESDPDVSLTSKNC